MKQTAVEWLINEIAEKHNFRFAAYYWAEIQQAEEMERQQIIDAYVVGGFNVLKFQNSGTPYDTATEYFTETYGYATPTPPESP